MMVNLSEKAYAFTLEHCPEFAPTPVVVGVSGGADSMCLLHIVCGWRGQGFTPVAVHVIHGIRGEEAESDAEFVRQQCALWDIPLRIVRADVPHLAACERMGLEETGRAVRYAVFEKIRLECGASNILTAHTASDQSETVLLNLMRGCGTAGLSGVPVCRDRVLRPLLFADRQAIEHYCADCNVPYIHDSTNDDCRYTRNAVRHRLIPLMQEIAPSVQASLQRVARHTRMDEEYLTKVAADCLSHALCNPGVYKRDTFAGQHESIRYRMLHLALEEFNCRSMEDRHFRLLCSYIDGEGGAVQLPGGVTVDVRGGYVTVSRNALQLPIPVPVCVTGLPFDTCFGVYELSLHAYDAEEYAKMVNVHNLFAKMTIDYDTIQGDLCVRSRIPGDRLHPAGRRVGKSVKDVMQECAVPPELRDVFPLLCDDTGVLLIPGICCDERVRVTEYTKHFLVCLVTAKLP